MNCDHNSQYGAISPLHPSFLSLSFSLSDLQSSHTCVTNLSYFVFCVCTKHTHFSAEIAEIKASWKSCEMSVTGCDPLPCLSSLFLSCMHARTHLNTHALSHTQTLKGKVALSNAFGSCNTSVCELLILLLWKWGGFCSIKLCHLPALIWSILSVCLFAFVCGGSSPTVEALGC